MSNRYTKLRIVEHTHWDKCGNIDSQWCSIEGYKKTLFGWKWEPWKEITDWHPEGWARFSRIRYTREEAEKTLERFAAGQPLLAYRNRVVAETGDSDKKPLEILDLEWDKDLRGDSEAELERQIKEWLVERGFIHPK